MNARDKRRTYNVLKDLLSKMGGKRCYNGQKLTGANLDKVRTAEKLFVLMIASLRLNADYKVKITYFERLIIALKKVDCFDLLTLLDQYDSRLIESCKNSKLRTVDTFKVLEDNAVIQEFQESLIALIKPFLQTWFSRKDELGFKSCHQVFSFLKRLSLELDQLKIVAFDSWRDTELEDDAPTSMANPEAHIISKWFPKASEEEFYSHFRPHHGSGQVAERVTRYYEKWDDLELDPRQVGFLRRIGHQDLIDRFMIKVVLESNFKIPCIVTFVNKSWKTYRTISMEPISNMWLQQGIGECFNYWLQNHKTAFSRYYSINSECVNRRLAWAGSMDGCYDTLDLSAASDSVSWSLVKNWFAKTCLAYGLYVTRTKYCEVTDPHMRSTSILEQRKFAPMGSRCCFPIETIVFGAICKATCESLGIYEDSGEYPSFVVYGDDIVIRREATDALIKRLSELGFKVNLTKSFYDTKQDDWGVFRESCGGEYLNGYDVKPLRLPRTFPGLPSRTVYEKDPSLLASLVVLANDCASLPFCSMFLVDWLINEQSLPLQWDENARTGLRSAHPSYPGYQRRWNSDLQRWEVKVLRLSKKERYLDYGNMMTHEHSHLARVISKATSIASLNVVLPPRLEEQKLIDAFQFQYLDWYLDGAHESARLYEWLRLNEFRHITSEDIHEDTNRWREPYEVQSVTFVWIEDPVATSRTPA